MAMDGPFAGITLAELGRQLRDGGTDPVELADRALAAARSAQPVGNAFVCLDPDGALAAADLLRTELARGADRGPLHGIPVAIKDVVDTAGLATTMGSRHFAGHRPARDAEAVARLRAAGAIIVGKTTTHEFAYGPTGDRSANGPCANPHDPRMMAGGSSAGSAAAVGAGLVPLALGTDTGGSVRIPAALCGVVGLRPTYGRIPTAGVFPLSWSLDTVGPIAGTVSDVAVAWTALAGAAPDPAHRDVGPPPATLRLGVPTAEWFERVDDTVRAALEAIVERLAARGASVRAVPIPDVDELVHLYRTVQAGEAVAIHVDRMTNAPELFDPEVLERLRAAAKLPAWDYARSLRRLHELRGEATHRLAGVNALVLPTVAILAPPLGTRTADLGGGWTSARDALLAFTAPWSVLGLPAISVPVTGRGPGELPIGVQFVGVPGGDDELLAVAGAAEPAT
jgi:aspartyl-tRNA(Asn)/glutamyl-tRNA(Gln) amidotransferase subunit A